MRREGYSEFWSDLALAVFLTAAHLAFVLATQPTITAGFGFGWDGFYYYLMAEGTAPPGHHYAERIAVPFLARHFWFSDLRLNFLIVNLIFGVVASVLWYLAVARIVPHASLLTKITAWLLVCATGLSPIPMAAWYPIQTDTGANAFLFALFYALLAGARSPLVYLLIFMGGTLVRENFAAFAVFFSMAVALEPPAKPYHEWLTRSLRSNRAAILMLAGAIAGSALAFVILMYATPYNPLGLKTQLFLKWVGRHSLVSVITGLIAVLGAAWMFYVVYRAAPAHAEPVAHPLRDRRWLLAVGLLALFIVCLGGGTNRERYYFWALPLAAVYVTPYVEALIRRRRYGAWAFAFVFMLVFQRSLVPIEPSGMGGCDLWSYVSGNATFIGHWTQECPPADAIRLSLTYVAVCVAAFLLVRLGERLTSADQPNAERAS
jgi:hypothetical protein